MSDGTKTETVLHQGSCHCGKVRFEASAPAVLDVYECNCSICTKKQIKMFFVPSTDFKILEGEDHLSCYSFNTHTAKHLFCKTCGVHSFFIPRLDTEAYGVAISSVDTNTIKKVNMVHFDGRNWEEALAALTGKST